MTTTRTQNGARLTFSVDAQLVHLPHATPIIPPRSAHIHRLARLLVGVGHQVSAKKSTAAAASRVPRSTVPLRDICRQGPTPLLEMVHVLISGEHGGV
jgi:hypothetical protein